MKTTKRILALLVCLLMVLEIMPVSAVSAFAEEVPEGYTPVYTVEDLYCIRYGLDGSYILMNDIDLTEATAAGGDWDGGYGWSPIGEDSTLPFTGTFDGNGYTISGMRIDNIQTAYAGLFGYVTGNITDLTLKDCVITSNVTNGYCGTLAGYSSGNIENINIENIRMTSKCDYTGGLVAQYEGGHISDVKVNGSINATPSKSIQTYKAYCGGIAGYVNKTDAVIERCANASAVTFMCSGSYDGSSSCYTYGYCGGIAGYVASSNTTISESYNTGVLTATASNRCSIYSSSYLYSYSYSYCGGIIGYGSKAVNCYNTASVSGTASAQATNTAYPSGVRTTTSTYTGGICGSGNAENCINLGEITATGDGKNGKQINKSAIALGTLKNNYYKVGTAEKGKSGTTDTATTAVSLTDAQMKLQSCFGQLDFENVWVLDIASGAEYPQLKENREYPDSGITPEPVVHENTPPEGMIGVYTVEDLYAVRNGLDKNYILMNDIDLTEATAEGGDWDGGYGWTPIGAGSSFTGTFDGNGYAISGMRITGANDGYVGLFSYINGGTVENLKLADVNISHSSGRRTGAVCGYGKNLTLTNVSVTGTVNASSAAYVGGLIGCIASGNISLCHNEAAVTGASHVGGIAGYVEGEANISLCYNKAAVNGYNYVGGIAGYSYRTSEKKNVIANSYNMGAVKASNNSGYVGGYAGGILGYGESNSSAYSPEVISCINLGTVFGNYPGGIAAWNPLTSNSDVTLSNCYYLSGTAARGKYDTTDTATTAVKLTAAQMKLKAVFGLLDFDTVWFLDTASGINYPQLINNPEAEAESVTITSLPAKTSYLHHDALDIKGLKISVKYKGVETPVEKTAEMNMISGYDPEQLGEQTLTVSYLNRSDTFKVTVNELPVASVTPDKTSFSLDAGKTETITATVFPENATYKDITWTSDDDTIATVDANGTVTAVSKGIAVITATAKSGAKADCVVTVLLPATSVSLDKESVTLNEGGTYALTASLTPAASTDTYTFASSNTDIVLVSDTGVVTGVSKGTATVTVTTSRGVAANCTVTVLRPATGVTLNATEKGLDRGETFLLKATVSPSDTTDTVTWSSSAPDVASVTSAGKVTALAAGTAIITVTTDSGKTASCTVTVIVPATGIELSPAEKTINVNNTCSFDVILTPSDANEFITWTSSDENIAVVDIKGIVTGKGRGTATITATTSRGYKATAKVNVLVPATGVTLSETAVSVDITKTYKLSYTLTPADSTDTVTWSSSDDSVLTVAADGTVTALKKGTAKAVCTAKSGAKAECTVTVLVPADKIELNNDTLTVEKGKTALLAASLLPAESTDTYTWSSSDTKVATVNNGTVTAVGAGSAEITVTTSRGKTAVCSVKVIVPATGVSLNKTTADVDINKTLKLTATLSPDDCTDNVIWSSSDENIVTVAADGTVTATAKGSATVTATAESGENASCVITVLVPAASVSVSPDFVELEENGTAELTAALTPANSTDTYMWVSSDESIAAVDANGNVTATGRGTVTISAVTSRGVKGDCTVKIRFPADSVTLADSDIKLDITKSARLTATLLPAGANDVITWTSSDDSVVSVAPDGTVTALKKGTATITATTDSGKTATCVITVLVPASKIALDSESITLNIGENKTLKASLTPADSTDTYAWSSSAPAVATVENGKVTALAKGTAVITVTTSRGLTAECTVTVLVPSTSVKFDVTSKSVNVGDSFKLTAAMQPANSTDSVTYSSSNTAVATVAADGTVKAVGKGTATITATTDSGKTATCVITVLVPASKIALDSASISLNVGENKTLKASLTPADTTDTYAWSSSAPAVAKVENGKVTALAKGTAVITATTSRGLTAKCTVTVLVPSTSVKFDVSSKNVNIGGSFKLTASMQPANSTDSVTYSSSNTAVATVAADGTVKAIGKGTATITAKTASGKTATCTVTVLLPSTGIKLNKTSASMKTGESLTFTATLTPAGSTDSVSWKTSNAKVATVSGGTVKAVGAGSATITATTASGKSASCNVTVAQSVTGVTLNKTAHSVTMAGQYLQLTATVAPSNAANKAVTWSSDNTKVATVDKNGKVTIIGFDTANITVKTADGGKTATCKITALGIKLGDVDKDGKITAADARLALRKSVGLEKFSEGSDQFLRSDVDSDKKVTAADARLILRASVGLEKLPEGGGHYHIYNTAAKTVAPTCTAEGYTSNVCMICKQTIKSNTTKALGHSWKAATCTAPKTCTRCGAKEGSALGHNWKAATCTAAKTCTRCGAKEGSALGHSWKAATCTAAKTCTRCGAKEGNALGHNWKAATCTAAKTCTRCGATSGSALGHSWKAATCTAAKTCTRCGAKEGSALGHNYSAATCTSAAKCTRCGATSGSALGHNYVSGKCSRCGAEPEAKITLPTLPKTISYRPGSSLYSSTRVDTISITQRYYSYDNDITVTVYLSGECLYHSNGSGQSDSMKIGWKLYDSEGYVVDSGTAYSDAVKMGEKYKTDFIIFDLSPNETYRLEFLNVN